MKQKRVLTRKVERLRKELKAHDELYYNKNNPIISDAEYDRLSHRIDIFESKYSFLRDPESPTQKVSIDRDKFFEKRKHKYRMLSLDNAFTNEDLNKFFSRFPDLTYTLEDKIDGLSLEVQYTNGKFLRAITRGDGLTGDVVTDNAKQIKNIPHTLSREITCSVFGEVCMPKDKFIEINQSLLKEAKKPYANARNLASGTLKLHDPKLVLDRGLKFIAYGVKSPAKYKIGVDGQIPKLKWLSNAGFSIPNWEYTRAKEIPKVLEMFDTRRPTLPYDVDGVVIKVSDYNHQEKAGHSNKAPKWAIAWKFASEQAVTTLEDIIFNVGRTGAVIPVAVLTPVQLSGSTISRATLHNEDFIISRKLSIGSQVAIEKGGDIIPKVLFVTKVVGDYKEFKFPKKCPICNSILYRKEGDAKTYCPDTFSKCTQFQEKIFHFTSKNALDMQGVGESVIKFLIEMDMIKSIPSLYKIKTYPLSAYKAYGETSANNIVNAIQSSLNQPMDRFLFGFGIPGIGSRLAKVLCDEYPTWRKLQRAALYGDINLEGFGETLRRNLRNWFCDVGNRQMIKDMKALGMPKRMEVEIKPEAEDNPIKGKNICITGRIGDLPRSKVTSIIELLGGNFHSSLKKSTDLLICGENTGAKKKEYATLYNIEVLSDIEQINKLLGL